MAALRNRNAAKQSMGDKRRVRDMFLSAVKSAIRRFVDVPAPVFAPGDHCLVTQSLVADTGGTLLSGSLVEITGVQDPKGRYQIKVLDIPDYQWTETRRLPYGPNFILFVEEALLKKVER